MIKNISLKKWMYASAIIVAGFTLGACEEDPLTNEGMEDFPAGPNVSVEVPFTELNIVEEDSVFEITVKLDKSYVVDVPVYLSLGAESTITDHEVSFPAKVIVPAGKTTTTFEVEVHADCDAEETKTGVLTIGTGPSVNATVAPATINFALENYVSPGMEVEVSWEGTTPYYDPETGELVDPTDLVDFDVYLNEKGADPTDEETEDFAIAASGSYEHLEIPGDTPDGTYIVYAHVYAIEQLQDVDTLSFPIVSTFARCGSFSGIELEQEEENVVGYAPAADPEDEDAEEVKDYRGTYVPLAEIVKSNNTFTVNTLEATELVQGRVRGLEGASPKRK